MSNLTPIMLLQPNLAKEPELTPRNQLHIAGYFQTQPLQVKYEMLFLQIDGVWRIDGLAVDAVPAQAQATFAPFDTKTEAQKLIKSGRAHSDSVLYASAVMHLCASPSAAAPSARADWRRSRPRMARCRGGLSARMQVQGPPVRLACGAMHGARLPERSARKRFTMRSSSEWKLTTASRPPGFKMRSAAASARSSSPSSPFT